MKRLQRLRANNHIRDLAAETEFNSAQLIQPLFVVEGVAKEEAIPGLGETKRQSIEAALAQVERDLGRGVSQYILFPVPAQKRESNLSFDFGAKAVHEIKKRFQADVQLWVDTCMCSFTSHGHCCLFHVDGRPNHEATLAELARGALLYAESGANGISPSDMMDGRIAKIRSTLDKAGFDLVPIMSYSTKFASNFYGPFREAADSAPKFGDRRSYQIDVRNRSDALNASVRCAEEGADLLMVKPGMTSIDLIAPIRERTGLAVGAYQVSGEFAALTLLAEKNLIQFNGALVESWHVFKRAGAQFIITYGARYAKELGVPLAASAAPGKSHGLR